MIQEPRASLIQAPSSHWQPESPVHIGEAAAPKSPAGAARASVLRVPWLR